MSLHCASVCLASLYLLTAWVILFKHVCMSVCLSVWLTHYLFVWFLCYVIFVFVCHIRLYTIFENGSRQPIFDMVWVMLDHPRSAIVSPSWVYKYGVDQICSFENTVILRFQRFTLKSRRYFRCACAESTTGLPLKWQPSTYLDSCRSIYIHLYSPKMVASIEKKNIHIKNKQ